MTLFPGRAAMDGHRIVTADCPWEHENYGQAGHAAAKAHYDEMSVEDLCRMPVRELGHPQGTLLFLWGTSAQAADGACHEVADAWGFDLRTRAFTWTKVNPACVACGCRWERHQPGDVQGKVARGSCDACAKRGALCKAFAASAELGPGNYTGGNVEDVWLGVSRGNARTWSRDRRRRDVRSAVLWPGVGPGDHSRKPEAVQDRIELLWPFAKGEAVELFARRRRRGWHCWGAQCPDPDLVFGTDVGAVWPVTPRPAVERFEQLPIVFPEEVR